MFKKYLPVIAGMLGVYLVFAGVSYAAFSYLNQEPEVALLSPVPGEEDGQLVDTTGPKTEPCPLNGQLYTKEERQAWEKRRPLMVMVENHQESRPQSGLTSADVVYEAVAEGGITRFMAAFYCDAVSKETIIGPVRSARTYFLDWASEYSKNPLYVHVGGAHCDPETGQGCLNGAKADALGQIQEYGWGGSQGNDINQFSVGFPTFWRDYERLGRTVATEHTMYTTTEKLWSLAKERGWSNLSPEGEEWQDSFIPWNFTESEPENGEVSEVSFNFWEGYQDYAVKWQYNPETKVFRRFNGGEPHKDLNNDDQLWTKNLVVQFVTEAKANDGYPGNVHLLYGTTGSGEALIFQNGQVTEAKWTKSTRTDRTQFTTLEGEAVEFLPGKIWLEALPVGTDVSY